MQLPMRSKELVAAFAEPLILSLLSRGEDYGYAIIQEIKAHCRERVEWTDGMLYPVLHHMEDEGWIDSRWVQSETGRKRKYYAIRNEGRKALREQTQRQTPAQTILAGLRKEAYV